MFFTYIIQSIKNKHYYIGFTNNFKRRLFEHKHNKTKSLRNKGPFELVYIEEFPTYFEAQKREKQIKSYKGGVAFKRLLS